MKRCRFGAAGLVVLLVLGLLCSAWTGNFFSDGARKMALAAESEPEEAMALVRQVHGRWARWRGFHAALYDHAPMEEIDTLFALLDPQADTFREGCIRLSQALDALARSHQPNVENLF